MKGLDPCCAKSLQVLLFHWGTTRRWIHHDRHVDGSPMTSTTGIPQGDATSPLILTLLMLQAYDSIMAAPRLPEAKLYLSIYMDDGASATNSKEVLQQVLDEWRSFSEQHHLLENEQKLELVSCIEEPTGVFKTHAEVLGGIVGNPTRKEFFIHSQKSEENRASQKDQPQDQAFAANSADARPQSLCQIKGTVWMDCRKPRWTRSKSLRPLLVESTWQDWLLSPTLENHLFWDAMWKCVLC